jgi:copper chaperone NosL
VVFAGRLVRAIAVCTLFGCGGGVRPLVAGTDACDFCRMTVSDVRYGAEVVARTGRVYTFDSIECVASWVMSSPLASGAKGVWVADYSTGALVPADSALFVKGGNLHSPMGRDITAFGPGVTSAQLAERFGGVVLRWQDVATYIRAQGLPGASPDAQPQSPATTTPGRP